jgi:hypothetical protein
VIPQAPSEISRLRISDADRDRAASFLGDALAEGRLSAQEHSERLDAVLAARTHADIVPLVSDLPGAAAVLAPQYGLPASSGQAGSLRRSRSTTRMIAVLSGITKKGPWQVPPYLEAVTVLGGAELDLRDAVLPAREIRIRAICVLGGVDIIVPPEMRVVDDGWALMGGRETPPDSPESLHPNAPVLRISGVSVLGGLSVRRRRREPAGELPA